MAAQQLVRHMRITLTQVGSYHSPLQKTFSSYPSCHTFPTLWPHFLWLNIQTCTSHLETSTGFVRPTTWPLSYVNNSKKCCFGTCWISCFLRCFHNHICDCERIFYHKISFNGNLTNAGNIYICVYIGVHTMIKFPLQYTCAHCNLYCVIIFQMSSASR